METKKSSRGKIQTTKLLLSQVIDFLPDPTFAIDLEGRVIVWNKAMETLTGARALDMVGKENHEYALPFYHERRPILIDMVLKADPEIEKKYVFVRHEGESFFAETVGLPSGRNLWGKASPIYDESGRLTGAIESIRDITEIREVEKGHEHALKQLAQLIDFLPDPTFAINADGRVTVWNRAIEDLTGMSAGDILGKEDCAYSLPFYGSKRPMLADLVLHPDNKLEQEYSSIRRENGSLYAESEVPHMGVYLWGKASPIYGRNGEIMGAIESVRDITEWKHTERSLRQSEEKYRDIFQNVSDFLYTHDLDGRIIETNLATKMSTGYTEADLLHLNIRDIIPERFRPLTGEYVRRVMEKGYDEGLMTIMTKNGHERIMEYRNSLILDRNGTPTGIRGSARDITSRIEAARQLKRERDFSTSIIQTSPAFYDAVDPEGKVIFMNQAMLNALGYTLQEVSGKNYASLFIPEDDHDAFSRAMDAMVSSREPVVHENRVLARDGTAILVQWQGKAVFREDGGIAFVFGIGINITRQRLAQELVRASEKKFETAFQSSPVPSSITDIESGRIVDMNSALGLMMGYSREEAIGKTSLEIGIWENPADRDRLVGMVAAGTMVDNEEVGFRIRNGEVRNILYSGRLIDIYGKPHVLSHVQDITEQKRTEEALRVSEEKFSTAFRAGPALMAINVLEDGRYVDVNETFIRTLGYTRDEVIGRTPEEIGIFADRSYLMNAARIFHEQDGLNNYELLVRAKDGRTLVGLFSADIIRLRDSMYWVTFMTDITEKRQAEEALRQSEERYRLLVENTTDVISRHGRDSTILFITPSCERMLGYRPEELTGKQSIEFIHPADKGAAWGAIKRAREQGTDRYRTEFRVIRKDGSVIWVEILGRIIQDEHGNIPEFYSTMRDITEKKLAEEELRTYESRLMRSQKLEAIGTLAGGIAHDFNNILSAIIGYSELALEDLPEKHPVRESMEEVLKAGDRARELVRQILTFSRQMETERRPVKVQLILKEALRLLRASIPSTISITERIDSTAGPVFADPTYIHQVIMNLCTNAYHAMLPGGGVMTVSIDSTCIDTQFASLHPPLEKGPYLKLTVQDTGSGMDAETLKRIFDPFFTTKEKAKGTGLGLATVHGIVTDLGGTIIVASAIGSGSTFEVLIPMTEKEPDYEEEPDVTLRRGSGQSILLVDDEEAILHFTTTMLEQFGYRVTAVSTGTEALELFRAASDRFDLIITDQTMPGMTGSDLAKAVLAARPSMPIVLMTGYSETITPEEALARGIEEYIDKPFTRQTIARAVQRCLSGG